MHALVADLVSMCTSLVVNFEMKKKLLIFVGAGASIDFDMPSVWEVNNLFEKWANEHSPLANNPSKSLYKYICEKIEDYYKQYSKEALQKKTNFEENLYVLLQLSAHLSDELSARPLNAFARWDDLPEITIQGKTQKPDGNDLHSLHRHLSDKLLHEFRARCENSTTQKKQEIHHLRNLLMELKSVYEVIFVSLNYDNIILQADPSLNTGFDSNGKFDKSSLENLDTWNHIFCIHGSVHFDMPFLTQGGKMHEIRWADDFSKIVGNNSLGRSGQNSTEGIDYATSVLIAGYGKSDQIQRVPFRTYYSKINALVDNADAFLFLGYGFADQHGSTAIM